MMKKALLTGIIIIAASSLSYAMDCSNLRLQQPDRMPEKNL
ncbi:hypothetical protein ACLG6S_16800 [Thermodesulfobacteriota bacterium B35]